MHDRMHGGTRIGYNDMMDMHYIHGFVTRCTERNVDAIRLIKQARPYIPERYFNPVNYGHGHEDSGFSPATYCQTQYIP